MTNTFFTADTHFAHANIIKFSKRPFQTVEEMDEALIDNWNARVKRGDDVWHLGDFNYRGEQSTAYYVSRLNGRIHMVWGNHDDHWAKKENARAVVDGYLPLFASVQDVKYLKLNGKSITLYHYAQRVWRNSHHGAWHLFGHSHGCLPNYHRSMDVGVDAHHYEVVSFEEVEAYMEAQVVTNHHPELVTDPWDKR